MQFRLVSLSIALLLLAARPAHAQLRAAYFNGYKPMLDLASKLNDLANSADKREDYSAVKDLGDAYVDKLNKMITALDTAGSACTDDSNKTFVKATCATPLASARTAKDRAERLRDKGSNKENCRAEVQSLQVALTDLSEQTKKCWEEHENYLKKVDDIYANSLRNWVDKTKDVSGPLQEVGKKLTDAKDKADSLKARAAEVGKLFKSAMEQDDKARSELFSSEKLSADDQKSKFEAWQKSDELLYKVTSALAEADKAARDADAAYSDTYKEFLSACEEFKKKESEANDQYKTVVLGLRNKLADIQHEYQTFSW